MRTYLLPAIVVIAISPRSARSEEDIAVIDEATLIGSLDRDPRLEGIQAEIDAAGATVEAARVRPEPRIAVEREQVFPSGDSAATNYLRVAIPLDVSGRRGHLVESARAEVDAVRAEGELARWAVIVDGLRVYRDTAYQRLRGALMRTERDALVRVVDIVAKRARAGEASGYDQQRLQLELGAYDDAIASSTIELAAAQRRLATIAGRGDARVDAAGDLALQGPPGPLESLVAAALASRGDYRAARRRMDAAEAASVAAGRRKIPMFEIGAGAMTTDVGSEHALGFVAGLSLNLPIFDRGQADAARARADRRGAAAALKLLERNVPPAIRGAYETWAARVVQATAFRTTQVGRIDQLLRSAETAYREGGGSIVELLDAYRTARDARLRELELRRDASLAELDLWLALGRRP